MDSFCSLPFVHSCTNVGGRNKPCCRFSDMDYNDNINPIDYFKSAKLDKLRQKMLAGDYIKGCQKCYDEEKANKKSYRQQSNEKFQVDTLDPSIKFIEIGLSNSCNFACVTCDAAYSTTWWKDIDAVNELGANKAKPETQVVYTDDNFSKQDLIDLEIVKLLGGEPLMEPKNLEFLSKVNLSNIQLVLITNASVAPNKQWQEVLSKVKRLSLDISIDGVGKTAEFVRHGTNWAKVQKNIQWWINWSKTHNMDMRFHYVVHNFNIHNIQDYEKWNTFGIKTTFDVLRQPEYLNIKILPKKEKAHYLNTLTNPQILNYLKQHIDYEDSSAYETMTLYKNWLEKNR